MFFIYPVSWGNLSSDTFFRDLDFHTWNSIKDLIFFILKTKYMQNKIYNFSQLLCQMTHTKNVFNHTRKKSLQVYLQTRVIYGKLRVLRCTCVAQHDFCWFWNRWFSVSILDIKNENFCRSLLIKSVRSSTGISVQNFAHAKTFYALVRGRVVVKRLTDR